MSVRPVTTLLVFLAAILAGGCSDGGDPPGGPARDPTRASAGEPTIDREALAGLGRLAFVGTVDGRTDLFVLHETGDLRNVTQDAAVEGKPAWSPDGTRIAYGSGDGDADLMVARAGGDGIRRLTALPANEGAPSWSPDGAQIVFGLETVDEERFGIYVIAADGGKARHLIGGRGCTVQDPAWSPDGRRIAFASNCIDGRGRSVAGGAGPLTAIYTMDLRGRGLRRLTAAHDTFGPEWSPDGRRIAYFSHGGAAVYSVEPDGTDRRKLTPALPSTVNLDWTADGRHLVLVDHYGGDVKAVDARGGDPVALTRGVVASAGISAFGGSGAGRRRSQAPPATACGEVPRRLVGSYYTRTERRDLPPELMDEPVGVNLLLLGPGYHRFWRVADRSEHSSPVCVSGTRLRLPATTSGPCAGRGPGTYTWRLDRDHLRLTRVRDACAARVFSSTARPLRRFNSSGFNCESRPDCGHKLDQIALLERTGSCASAGCSR